MRVLFSFSRPYSAYNLDEHLFTENATLELLQIRWHPASPTDSHLLVLLSDNSIRVYDVDSLRHVWRIGPTPTPQAVSGAGAGSKHAAVAAASPGNVSSPGVTSKLAYLNSLGDTAVDFDIAPPRVVSSATGGSGSIGDTTFSPTTILSTTSSTVAAAAKPVTTPKEGATLIMNDSLIAQRNKKTAAGGAGGSKVEWPIVILRGDGNVYVLCAGIDTNRPKLQGPISIQPQVDDNYGLDSCSLIVIPTLPPTVIIAESTGKTHHALFLEESCPLERSLTSELADSNLTMHPCEWYLHVLETVELELGLPSVEETKEAKSYSCPLHLKRDPLNEARYFAYHNAGLHAVTLDFTRPLHEFVERDGGEDLLEKYPLFSSHSRAEYVVCTKALQNANTNAVLGFTLLQSPSGLVLFLASGQVVSLDLITDHSLIRKWPLPGSNKKANGAESPIKNMLKDSFQKRIQSILKSGLTQPILKLDQSTEPTPQEAFELLTQATRMLRENYFVRHEKARQEIEKREHVLKLLKQQQLNDIEELQVEKQNIRATAERLAETYEDLCDKQNSLFKRYVDAPNRFKIFTPHLPPGSGNMTVVDKVPPEMLHMVHPHWNQFPPMNPLWHSILGFAIFMLGMISMTGNGCVMYIFTNTKSLRTPSNLLVVNLAFSDFFMMFTMGPPMVINCWHETWVFGPFACEVYACLGSLFGCASIWTMTMIAFDRYNVIVKGLSAKPMTNNGALLRIFGVWVFALFWTLAPFFGWNRYVPEGNMTACGTDYLTQTWLSRSYIIIYAIFVYWTPLLTIIYSYTFILKAVSAHEKNMREQAKKMNVASLRSQEAQNTSTEMKLAKVALVTISLWFMAWTPYLVINFTGIFKAAPISPLATIWGSLFAKANAVYNPIVYGISHPKYRAALYQKFPSLSCQDSGDDGQAQEVVRLATLRLPKGSFSEKQFTERIEQINQSVKVLQKSVDQAKQKIATQQIELESKKNTAKEKTFNLPVKQEEIIKQIIGEMYTQIDGNTTEGKNYLKASQLKQGFVSTSVRKYSKKTAAPERAYNSDDDSDSDDERDNAPRQRQRKERGNSEFWRRKMRTLHGVLDVNKDGVISYDDFMLLADKFASLGHLDTKAKNEFRDIMRTTWEQQWGEITPYNLVTVEQYLTEMHHVVNDKDLKKKVHRFLPYLYKAVDKDRSGSISMNEFKLFFRCLGLTEENAAVSFAVIDKNGDGQITLDEFVKLGKDFFVSEKETHVSRMFWGPLVDH
uniref:G-protein coupled receptors family 1 profile domain-containing protein n=3 Tax=leucosphyrus subgroup TaxID=44539 RepID=A0A182NQW7_9DIPT